MAARQQLAFNVRPRDLGPGGVVSDVTHTLLEGEMDRLSATPVCGTRDAATFRVAASGCASVLFARLADAHSS